MKNEEEEKMITLGLAVLFHCCRIFARGATPAASVKEAKAFVVEAKKNGVWPVRKESA